MYTTTWKRTIWGILMMGCLLSQTGTAQEVSWSYRVPSKGWIGITVDFTMSSIGGVEETVVVISEVVDGSPAEAAGIQVGDTITQMNGRAASQRSFSSLNLEPGDLVDFVVNREGGSREITVVAGERPRSHIIVRPDIEEMAIKLDTLRWAILNDLDSLRLSIEGLHLDETGGDFRIELLRRISPEGDLGGQGGVFRFTQRFSDTLFAFAPGVLPVAPDFAMPFEAFLVKTPETEALRAQLLKVKQELISVRRDELSRRRAIAAAIQGPVEEALSRDALFQELRAKEEELVAEEDVLSDRLARVSEEQMRRQWVDVEARAQEASAYAQRTWAEAQRNLERLQEERTREAEEHYRQSLQRFRSPVIVGQNLVYGADLAPLTPAMAEMLSAEQGVVVYEVIEGTPAAEIGLKDLDVIVQVAGQEIRSVGDFRVTLGMLEKPISLVVIRKGEPEPVEILIRR
jgi:C-terminal processing protease CtpA/Prc